MIHGGYWQAIYNLTHAGHLCVDLAAHGIATWNVEYRRIGDPGGGWPGALDDVCRRSSTCPCSAERLSARSHARRRDGSLCGRAAGAACRATRTPVVPGGRLACPVWWICVRSDRQRGRQRADHPNAGGDDPRRCPTGGDEASPSAHLPLGFRYVLACGTEDIHWEPNEALAKQAA